MSKAKGSTYSHSETVAEGFLQGVNLDCNDLKIPSLQAAPASGSLCDGTSTWCSLIPSAGEPFPSPTPSSEQPLLTSCCHTQDCRFEDELSPHVEMMENAPPSWENFTLDKSPAEDDTIRNRSPKELSTPALLQQALSDHNLLSTPEGFTDAVHGGGEGAALSNKKASGDGATNIPSTLDAPAPRGGLDVTMGGGATTTPSHGARAELDMDTQVVLNDSFPYCFQISSNTSRSALSSQGIVFTQRFRGGMSIGGVKEGEMPPPETSEANECPQDREESRSQTSRELNYGLKGEERDASCTATHRSVSSSASCFTVGMPVEVHMDALWHSATVIESEKDGHVVVNVCEDETVLRLPVGMVRRASLMDSDGTESAHYFVEEPIIRHPNVVDICATAGSGNKPVCSQGVTLNARCGYTQDNEIGGWVHPSTLVIFVEPRANESLSCGSRLVLESLVKLGLTVVQCLEELESSRSAADSGLQGKGGQYCTRHYSGVYFVVVSVSENSAKEEAYNVVAAHAMGISAVSVQWLERLYSDGAWNQRRVGLPLRDELVGQGSCDILRYHLLRREQRVFTSNVVYVPECEHEIELLIELCGAVVTHTLPQHDEVDVVGHFAYVNVIGQFQETGEFHSFQQVDRPWLFHRIHEFFAELPPTRGEQSACNCDNVTDYNALSNKHRRDETWGRGAFDECYLRPDLTDSSAAHVRSELYPLRPTCATDEMNEIRVGDDYYFCIPSKSPSDNRNSETRSVGIGRVLEVTNDKSGHRSVTMRIYQSKETERSQGEHDNRNLNSHQRIYMGTQSVVVKESDLVFDTPVYVLKASEMAHLFIVESPPRDAELGPEGTV
uniref:WGS project CAEQ00000000 data, annotated contig 312 n=1 Tax=Trypanosoma congolense (strain IL3000) TaxID=1068625 RepID=F9WET4_TRYCI|nr:unnamed protein product [Trypanosoma congolense IL3000]